MTSWQNIIHFVIYTFMYELAVSVNMVSYAELWVYKSKEKALGP